MLNFDKAARRLYTSRSTGETLHLSDGLPPTVGFAVGREGWEMRLGQEAVSEVLIREWLIRVITCKTALHPYADWAVGVWYDKGFVYLDVVNVVEDRDDAIRLGRDRSQLAIYDLSLGQCIELCREPIGDPGRAFADACEAACDLSPQDEG